MPTPVIARPTPEVSRSGYHRNASNLGLPLQYRNLRHERIEVPNGKPYDVGPVRPTDVLFASDSYRANAIKGGCLLSDGRIR